MKLNIDPMPALIANGKARLNDYFNGLAQQTLHVDQAHRDKRALAAAIAAGGAPTAEFAAEAQARQMTPTDLAKLILSKPDDMARRELGRQLASMKIEAAKTPADIEAVLSNINW